MQRKTCLSYTLLVTGPAYGTQQASSAYLFAQALFASSHHLKSIFFYHEGVYNANRFTEPASDEFNLVSAWGQLAKQHGVPLNVCVSAALRRGMTDKSEKHAITMISSAFTISGLGELTQSILTSDRFIQF